MHGDQNTREWDLYVILSVTHRLPVDLDPWLEILGFLIGDTGIGVVQGAAAQKEARDWVFTQHPQLRDIPAVPDFAEGDDAAMDEWANRYKQRYGQTLPLRPLPQARQVHRTVLEATLALAPSEKVIVINPDDDPGEVIDTIADLHDRHTASEREEPDDPTPA
ncbi:hypothetical protein [Actinomadura fibrosa]|uniref:Uncharacterized protein n=1 Tax=Actinomadura fibrosa TaxID=111802 RepID=A0ABW2XSQ3_9ACTN|nr:hypothetical protein [Actinomadura fibrosa]